MARKESEAVTEGNGPVPQQEEFGSGEPTLADSIDSKKEWTAFSIGGIRS